ncbi:nicotinate-nucleotide--dimethylbenzimidazole phosphoribosyltransferase [Stenotrophomonas sp. HITSZ_GD]|uniref:nicotinate-nucleotide--dimethylbenzimidazole phosphoribosyltransferase n=1 Tax=Stenotrophomonas sp. HITSZ_GD TaxID=3037248 RepID=UPI00240D8879|nr:nicotinate-nucleotide--dimethylbenzimidazole phosphoribosyltransferase [Stenotrophomonas sp. HITSZ_GD]MDG2525821.1 nicotinate-nucleotide--dimethylbenzimidazole phosphoribosyltransferase [Stenotrophomonas sp. HITSZ_GD]
MSAWWHAPPARPDAAIAREATARQARLTKPPGSLGRLEPLVIRLAALQGAVCPVVDPAWIAVFAADHGVAAEGVSAFPQAVTGEMLRNFARGGAAISVLARALDAHLEVVDLGTVNDIGPLPAVRRARIAPATANFCTQPAMTADQLDAALQAGADSVAAARAAGARLYIGGEMGIGNTTAAAALGAALLRLPPEWMVGAGTGLDAQGMAHKAAVIARALAWHAGEHPPLEWLRRLGGFEIAALAGACVAAAQAGLPVLVDGFIVSVAALLAVRLQPGVRDWLLFSHRSQENGHGAVLDALGAEPLLDLGLRLGEASGAALAVPLLRLACALHANMATFEEAGVSEA